MLYSSSSHVTRVLQCGLISNKEIPSFVFALFSVCTPTDDENDDDDDRAAERSVVNSFSKSSQRFFMSLSISLKCTFSLSRACYKYILFIYCQISEFVPKCVPYNESGS